MSTNQVGSERVGFRLSPQQERLLAADEHAVVQCAAPLSGPVNEGQLRQAFEGALSRHEILRTTFPRAAGVRGRTQVIADDPAYGWQTLESAPAELTELLSEARAESFDLEQGPLVRAVLVSPSSPEPLLVLTVHAAAADSASLGFLLGELTAGQPEEPVQYADYAEWRHEQVAGEDDAGTDGRAFWQAELEQLPARARLLFGGEDSGPRRVPVALSDEDRRGVEAAARAAGVPAATFLEACWHALIARVAGADELMLAGWCEGRRMADLAGAVGPYAQAVTVRTRIEPETSFAELLDQVSRSRSQAESWQDYASGEDLAAILGSASAAFAAVEAAAPMRALTPPPVSEAVLLWVLDGADPELWFDATVLREEDGRQLAGHLLTLLRAASADSGTRVLELPLTEATEAERLLAGCSGPAPAAGAQIPVHELFAQAAGANPEAPAVAAAGQERGYAELDAAANRFAHLLAGAGVSAGSTVGLCLERTPALLEALLGILKAGCAYLPLNDEHPPARLAHQLSESAATAVITQAGLLDRFAGFEGEVICVDRDAERIAAAPDRDPGVPVGPDAVAYVMYTSGSTGLPKGVAVTHGNLSNYATDLAGRLAGGESAGLRFGVVSAISTDLGNTCIFPALVSGGCVQLIGATASMDAGPLVQELGGARLDVLKITPSHLRALLAGEQAAEALPRRRLVLGGEALSWELVEGVRGLAGELDILNHYGPTETTIGCCANEVAERRTDSATVPIGRPLAGVRAYVLDRSGALLPPGVPGELCIAGAGVSRGYVGGRDDGGAFAPDPFAAGERMYRTGDRARYLGDGAIEFLGRVDDQVKVRGFRIEPGEIEAVLARHTAVRQAAVVPEPDERGELRLIAYVATSADPSIEELQAFLGQSLPEYMIPSAFATLEALPFTPSGKVDRRALAEMATVAARREAQFVGPRDEVEEQIAAIWSELLGVEQVGVFDDFFALGGHSLMATQAIMRIRRTHGDIPLRALLAAPTVATLAEVVRGGTVGER